MSIIIVIFFHVDLNILQVKVALLKIILMYICVYVLCQISQSLDFSIIILFS